MDKVPLSDPMGLAALAQEAPRFVEKASQLPPVRKKAHRKPNKVPDASDAHTASKETPEPPAPPTVQPQIDE